MKLRSAVVGVFIAALSSTAFADGMPIRNGRFSGGPSTVLALTPDQASALRRNEERGEFKVLVLSDVQRRRLLESAGTAPASLDVYDTRKGENDCTCEAENRGLWFEEGSVEVPHAYLSAVGTPTSSAGPLAAVTLGVLCLSLGAILAILRRRRAPKTPI
jgi:hypothetical protein